MYNNKIELTIIGKRNRSRNGAAPFLRLGKLRLGKLCLGKLRLGKLRLRKLCLGKLRLGKIHFRKKYFVVALSSVLLAMMIGCGQNEDELITFDEKCIEEERNIKETTKEIEKDENLNDDLAESINENISEPIYVYVCGAVAWPDVYALKKGERIVDAIDMAGGFLDTADDKAINLAQKVEDGMQIYVPTTDETKEALGTFVRVSSGSDVANGNGSSIGNMGIADNAKNSDGSKGITGKMVNINSADKAMLMTLPGIGESKAEKIIAYRENNGPFNQISDIMNVNGIKNGAYDKIKELICTN